MGRGHFFFRPSKPAQKEVPLEPAAESANAAYHVVAARVPPDTARPLSALARERDQSMSAVIRLALRRHLAAERLSAA